MKYNLLDICIYARETLVPRLFSGELDFSELEF